MKFVEYLFTILVFKRVHGAPRDIDPVGTTVGPDFERVTGKGNYMISQKP